MPELRAVLCVLFVAVQLFKFGQVINCSLVA